MKSSATRKPRTLWRASIVIRKLLPGFLGLHEGIDRGWKVVLPPFPAGGRLAKEALEPFAPSTAPASLLFHVVASCLPYVEGTGVLGISQAGLKTRSFSPVWP